jgi:hypothetical protein
VLIEEITLQEDVAETKDLMAVANYVSRWMLSRKNIETFDGFDMTLERIAYHMGKPIPPIQTKSVKFLLFKAIPNYSDEPLRFVSNDREMTGEREFGAYSPVPYHIININTKLLLQKKKNPASTILHELQHALDDLKSGGRALLAVPYKQPKDDYQAYLKHPMEVNARFSQALWDLASNYDRVARSDVYSAIANNLQQHRLRSEDFENPKEYKRLITRAYKFLADVSQIIDKKEKPGFVQTVKNLIKKYLVR